MLLGQSLDMVHDSTSGLHVNLRGVFLLSKISEVDGLTEPDMDRPGLWSEPVLVDLASHLATQPEHEDRLNDGILGCECDPSCSRMKSEEGERVLGLVAGPFGMDANQGVGDRQFFHRATDRVVVKGDLFPRSHDGRKHGHAAHEHVDESAQDLVVEESLSYWKEDSPPASSSGEDGIADGEEVKESSMVADHQNAVSPLQYSDMLCSVHMEATTTTDPQQCVHKGTIPDHPDWLKAPSEHVS